MEVVPAWVCINIIVKAPLFLSSANVLQRLVAELFGIHAQRLDREDELVVRV